MQDNTKLVLGAFEGQDLLVADLERSEPFSKVLLAGKVV
jgi:hypothetical protein